MVDIPSLLALIFCGFLLFSGTTRKIIFFTWLVGLAIAIKHLWVGSDFIGLGIIFESSLFSYVLFLITQGEAERANKRQVPKTIFSVLVVLTMSASLFWVVYERSHEVFSEVASQSTSLSELSKQVLGSHFLAIEALLLLAFLILIGLGLNLRKESDI